MAVAKAAMDSVLPKNPLTIGILSRTTCRNGSEEKTLRLLHYRAKQDPKRVIFAEADQLMCSKQHRSLRKKDSRTHPPRTKRSYSRFDGFH